MIDKGQMLSRHDFSKVNWGILAAAALLLTIGGALLMLPLMSNMEERGILTLLQTGAVTILLACILLALRHFLRPTQTYRLYEHGVKVFNSHNHQERFIPFEKIVDVYRTRGVPLLGNLCGGLCEAMAFRTAADQPWCTVYSNVSHAWALRDTIISQQILLRGPVALNALYQGEELPFHYLTGRSRWLTWLLGGKPHRLPGQTLRLSAKTLVTPQGSIDIAQVHSLDSQPQHGEIRLRDAQGQTLATLCYFSLLSADLFIALLEHMINNRIPAYRNPAMTRSVI
ncbi:hypothetical protein [Serratia rubidaea]|uniref:hypothetical protein n=1 Tax=Serratia rubidaea TaxID=61652 RepID=UPI002432D7E6|nr:hypothetical protein [Serratia rubidaea]MCR0996692.1 hypothetical protein [Serratia rubidaea]